LKDQYVGDINDYRKYDLLQILSKICDEKIFVVWMLTKNDNRNDGKKTKYIKYSYKWKKYNPALFEQLKAIINTDRNIELIQKLPLFNDIKKFEFYSEYIPKDIIKRDEYFKKIIEKAKDSKIIFFDPDNGIAPNKNIKESSKYLFWSDIEVFWEMGKDILFFQYFPWYCNRIKFINKKIEECSTRLRIKNNIMTFNAKNVVYIYICHDIKDKYVKLVGEWKKWE
jgi:hypothetical protein